MENISECSSSVRIEYFNRKSGQIEISGESESTACVTILDVGSLHSRAVGFMKGFVGENSCRSSIMLI